MKSDIKAARIEATKAYKKYVEEPKTSQRRERLDLGLVYRYTIILNHLRRWGGKPTGSHRDSRVAEISN